MTDYDAVAELAAGMTEKYRRGVEPGLEDRLAWDGLTDQERDQFMADSYQQIAHGKEKLEALDEDNRGLSLVLTPGPCFGGSVAGRVGGVREVLRCGPDAPDLRHERRQLLRRRGRGKRVDRGGEGRDG